jgi:hypothetical protein
MMRTASRERRVGRARSALDGAARRRTVWLVRATEFRSSPSEEEERTWNARPGASEEAQKSMNPMTCGLSPSTSSGRGLSKPGSSALRQAQGTVWGDS